MNRRSPLLFSLLLLAASARASADTAGTTSAKAGPSPFTLDLSSSLTAIQGTFNSQGEYAAFPSGSNVWAWVTALGASYRFNQNWEATLNVPFRQISATLPTGSITSSSILGPLLTAKFHVDSWAHPVLHAGISVPPLTTSTQFTGNPMASLPEDVGDAFVSGTSIPVGVGFSQPFGRFIGNFDATYTFIFPVQTNLSDAPPGYPQISMQQGNRLKLSENLGYDLGSGWNVTGGLGQAWTSDAYANGMDVPGTAGQVLSASIGAGFAPSADWRYTARFETLAPFYSLDVNQVYGPSVMLGISFTGI